MARSRRQFRFQFTLLAILLVATYVGYALLQPLEPVRPQTVLQFTPPAAHTITLPWPATGEGALEATGYGQLASYGPQAARPTASIIKLLTALVVLDQKPLLAGNEGPQITITQDDVDSYNKFIAQDGSVVRVVIGEQLSEYQALQALLLPSANNIAETLARWAYGSIDSFNAAAMRYTARVGMNSTVVTDPSGFAASTVSSPSDLLKLGEASLQNPVVAAIAAQLSATIPVQGDIHNVNFVLGNSGIIGLKTGNSTENPGAFLFAARQVISGQTVTLVGVTMDAPSLFTAVMAAPAVVRAAAASFTPVTIARANQPIAHYSTPWGTSIGAVSSHDIIILAWRGLPPSVTVQAASLDAPHRDGTSAGSLVVRVTLAAPSQSHPLVLDHALPAPTALWRLTHPQ